MHTNKEIADPSAFEMAEYFDTEEAIAKYLNQFILQKLGFLILF